MNYSKLVIPGMNSHLCLGLIFLTVAICGTCKPIQGQTQGYTQGRPVVGGPAGSTYSNILVPTAMALDASQFPGAPDMCAQINAAYTSSNFAGTIDATAFSGIQECVSNPFHMTSTTNLKTVHLYLNPNVTIVTSVPWFTPQVPHSIEGLVAGNIGPQSLSPTGGATILACGPTISLALQNQGLMWTGGPTLSAHTPRSLFPSINFRIQPLQTRLLCNSHIRMGRSLPACIRASFALVARETPTTPLLRKGLVGCRMETHQGFRGSNSIWEVIATSLVITQ